MRPALSLPQPVKTQVVQPIKVVNEIGEEVDSEEIVETTIYPSEREVQAALAAHRAAVGVWEAARTIDEEKLPRHPLAGAWLQNNPSPGVECIDRGDGLGPRLMGWVGDHPDIDSWAAAYTPPEQVDRAAKLAALATAKDSLDKASTVAGVKTAATAAIAALEARLAALEGK